MAELKGGATLGSPRQLDNIFHGITAVAELKAQNGDKVVKLDGNFPRHHRRGRIEGLPSGVVESSLQRIFHGITAVAELKEFSLNHGVDRDEIFHGITAVAELKDGPMSLLQGVSGIFHGITAVAELKGHIVHGPATVEPYFPRHHRRGRIEG